MNENNYNYIEKRVRYTVERIVKDTIMYSKNVLENLDRDSEYALESIREQKEYLKNDKELAIKELLANISFIIEEEIKNLKK